MESKEHTQSKPCELSEQSTCDTDFSDMISVFVGGFPRATGYSDIIKFFSPINEKHISTSMRNSNVEFRGFVFIRFKNQQEAEDFSAKELRYKNKLLTTRIATSHTDYINDCLNNLRYPKKVFLGNVPKNCTDQSITGEMSKYGPVEQSMIVRRSANESNFAYVTFVNTMDAQNLISKKSIPLSACIRCNVGYSNPKFSKEMLKRVHPALAEYILRIQKDWS